MQPSFRSPPRLEGRGARHIGARLVVWQATSLSDHRQGPPSAGSAARAVIAWRGTDLKTDRPLGIGRQSMASEPLERIVEQRSRVLSILCRSFFGSLVVYVGIAWFALRQGAVTTARAFDLPAVVPVALTAVAVMVLFSAEAMSRRILARASQSAAAGEPETLLNAYQSSTIVGFAMREGAAVIGLALTFLTASIVWVTALGAASATAMLIAWPRKDRFRRIALGDCAPID